MQPIAADNSALRNASVNGDIPIHQHHIGFHPPERQAHGQTGSLQDIQFLDPAVSHGYNGPRYGIAFYYFC